MTLGSVWPNGAMVVLTVGKATNAAIAKGMVAVRDTGTNPDSYKIAVTNGATGPFVVCVNKDAATTDPAFAAAFPGTIVTCKITGTAEPGVPLYCSTTTAGYVQSTSSGDIVGRYLGHENEISGKTPATAAADQDLVLVRLGGTY